MNELMNEWIKFKENAEKMKIDAQLGVNVISKKEHFCQLW